MTDPRPQYGELATPEEQRRAAGLPPVAVDVPGQVPDAAPRAAGVRSAGQLDRPAERPADRIATIALLAFGLVNVITAGLQYLDLSTAMNESMRILGVDGAFTNFAQAKLWGTVGAIVLVAGWSLTAVLSIRRLRRRKLTWWVPLVGAAVTLIVSSVFIAVPLFGDPAFVDYVEKMAAR